MGAKLKEATRKINLTTDGYADLFECSINFYEFVFDISDKYEIKFLKS